jgi:hypothetical protein
METATAAGNHQQLAGERDSFVFCKQAGEIDVRRGEEYLGPEWAKARGGHWEQAVVLHG